MFDYLIIVLVIALALAPLVQFLPSKRQRALARMREYAAVHGLFVEFRGLPDLRGERRPSSHAIYYGRRLPASLACGIVAAAWVRTPQGWRCVGGRLPVPPPIAELPEEIIAASIDTASCGVYWTEASGEAGVEQIREALARWSALAGQ